MCWYDDDGLYAFPRYINRPNAPALRVPPPEKPWLRQVLGDDWFADVWQVTLQGRRMTDADLAALIPRLAGLPELQRLNLRTTSVTGQGLQPLQKISTLDYLSLFETRIKIDDPGLQKLRDAMPQLRVGY